MEILLFVLIVVGFVLLIASAIQSRRSHRRSWWRNGSSNNYIQTSDTDKSSVTSKSKIICRGSLS